MRRTLTLSLFALLAAAALAYAGGPHGGHHGAGMMNEEHHAKMMEHLGKTLELTDDQKAAARRIHEEGMAKAKPLAEEHRRLKEEVHALLEADQPDATEIGEKMIAAHAAGEKLRALHEEMMGRFTALLTAEQRERFAAMHEHLKELHHGPGHPRPF